MKLSTLFLKKSLKEKILLIFIVLWSTLAFLFVFYNASKAVSEFKEWTFLSDTEKRQKLFGELYKFLVFVNQNIKEDKQILFLPKDEMSFYLARYYLFPRFVIRVDDEKKLFELSKVGTYPYMITFKEMKLENYTVSKHDSSNGYFYKRK